MRAHARVKKGWSFACEPPKDHHTRSRSGSVPVSPFPHPSFVRPHASLAPLHHSDACLFGRFRMRACAGIHACDRPSSVGWQGAKQWRHARARFPCPRRCRDMCGLPACEDGSGRAPWVAGMIRFLVTPNLRRPPRLPRLRLSLRVHILWRACAWGTKGAFRRPPSCPPVRGTVD